MIIDSEFKALISPLDTDERQGLEKSLLAEGCRDNLIAWEKENILLDGHNRYEICKEHNIVFQVKYISLPDRVAAKIWIIRNQLSRRNINAYQRVELALMLEDMIKAKAKENQKEHGNTAPGQPKTLCQNSDKVLETIDTKKELAKAAGVSHDTIHKVKNIRDDGIEQLKDKARSGEISVNTAATIAKAPKEEQKIIVELSEKEILSKAREIRQQKREDRKIKVESLPIVELPAGEFNIILADPPWRYEFSETESRSIENQ